MESEFLSNYSSKIESNFIRFETIVVLNCVLNATLMLVSIFGNILVLAAIPKTLLNYSPSTVFLCSLALSDLLVGVVVQPVYIANALTGMTYLQTTMATLAFAASGVSLFTMTVIAVDRSLSLQLVTRSRAVYLTAILWIVAVVLSFSHHLSDLAYFLAIAICIILCLMICTACYLNMYRIVRRHQQQIQAQKQVVLKAEYNHAMKKSTKSAKNTFIYYIAMVLCYLPMFITKAVMSVFPELWKKAWILTETVVFMNSAINPFLYCWRVRELRAEVMRILQWISCK